MYLGLAKVLLKDFKAYAQAATDRIRQTTEQWTAAAGRSLRYLPSSTENKEAWARATAERDGVRTGLIGVLSCVEPCWSYEIHRNRQTKQLELGGGPSKCLHYYSYLIHKTWGFMHLRLQTWFPFSVHVGLNGREWLGQQMDAAGLGYRRRENCFVTLEDAAKARSCSTASCGLTGRGSWTGSSLKFIRRTHGSSAPNRCPIIGRWIRVNGPPMFCSNRPRRWPNSIRP
jgi:hypothetical protein